MNGLITVRGNCDHDSAYPNMVVEEMAGKRLLITHGHLYNVKMTLFNLSLKSEEAEANIICSDTHMQLVQNLSMADYILILVAFVNHVIARKKHTPF